MSTSDGGEGYPRYMMEIYDGRLESLTDNVNFAKLVPIHLRVNGNICIVSDREDGTTSRGLTILSVNGVVVPAHAAIQHWNDTIGFTLKDSVNVAEIDHVVRKKR